MTISEMIFVVLFLIAGAFIGFSIGVTNFGLVGALIGIVVGGVAGAFAMILYLAAYSAILLIIRRITGRWGTKARRFLTPRIKPDQSSYGTFDVDLSAVSGGSSVTLQWDGQSPTPTDEGVYDGQEIAIRLFQGSSNPVGSLAWPSNVDFGPFTYSLNTSGKRDLLKLKWAKNAGGGKWEVVLVSQGYL